MSELINKITNLEKKIQDNKVEKAKLDERLENLKIEKAKKLEELKKYDVAEADLETTIIDMNAELEKEIERLEKELN